MSNQSNTIAQRSAKAAAPAVLDLGIVLINDATVGTPWGTMRMHQNAPRSILPTAARS